MPQASKEQQSGDMSPTQIASRLATLDANIQTLTDTTTEIKQSLDRNHEQIYNRLREAETRIVNIKDNQVSCPAREFVKAMEKRHGWNTMEAAAVVLTLISVAIMAYVVFFQQKTIEHRDAAIQRAISNQSASAFRIDRGRNIKPD